MALQTLSEVSAEHGLSRRASRGSDFPNDSSVVSWVRNLAL